MAFDALKMYRERGIDHITEGNKHCAQGWVQIHCPFCHGSRGYHLGYHIDSGAYNCWRCKTKSQREVIKALTNCSWGEAIEIQAYYSGTSRPVPSQRDYIKKAARCKLLSEAAELTKRHRKYLDSRLFDPAKLCHFYGLLGTGPIGGYKHRIMAPIIVDGAVVSYQGRDITGKSDLKYKACCKEDEVVDHQHIVYGIDLVENRQAVIVEGITDVWRLGPGAVCVFGTSFTIQQVNFLASRLDKAFLLFDTGDANAVKVQQELAVLLSDRGLEVETIETDDDDPGSMDQDDADAAMLELLGRGPWEVPEK